MNPQVSKENQSIEKKERDLWMTVNKNEKLDVSLIREKVSGLEAIFGFSFASKRLFLFHR